MAKFYIATILGAALAYSAGGWTGTCLADQLNRPSADPASPPNQRQASAPTVTGDDRVPKSDRTSAAETCGAGKDGKDGADAPNGGKGGKGGKGGAGNSCGN